MNKPAKNALSEEIMDILGLSLESLNRMTKSDLQQLHEKLSELKSSGEQMSDRPLSEILDETIGGKPLRNMTLGELMEKMDQGPLGLGILPEIRRVLREEMRGFLRKRRKE